MRGDADVIAHQHRPLLTNAHHHTKQQQQLSLFSTLRGLIKHERKQIPFYFLNVDGSNHLTLIWGSKGHPLEDYVA